MAFGRKTKEVDTSKSAFEIGGKGASEEGDDKEGSQEKNEEFEKQRDEALQVLTFERTDHQPSTERTGLVKGENEASTRDADSR